MKRILRDFFGRPEPSDEHDSEGPARKPDIQLPDDFDDEADFLQHMRKEFYEDISYDRLNREAAIEDLKFVVGDQWDDFVRQRREAARKPVITVNRIPAFIAQIVGARRQSETSIEVVPDDGGTKPIARIREDLIRSIEKESRASIAYDKALENSAMCGIGNFKLDLDYESDDVFDQKIDIVASHDALSVVWDRSLMDPTGRDAGHVFDVDTMTKEQFYRSWPWATPADIVVDVTLRGDLRMNGWIAVDDVRVVKYWRMRTRKRTLALMQDGRVLDITDLTDEKHPSYDAGKAQEALSNIATRKDGSPIMREVDRKYAEMYICSGLDVLEGPYRLEISRVPVFRVPGWEVSIGEFKHRWGLTRFMKDPQRLHNYWRSVWAERLMQSPRAVWIAAAAAVLGREQAFRTSHMSDDPLLIYNDDAPQEGKPERLAPAQIEQAFAEMAEISTQDLKDVSNIHEANLGMPSNEVSGAAITARQRVSDTGTVIYHDNLSMAIEECGRTANELIGTVYDTPRIVKTVGTDARTNMVAINQIAKPDTDITSGKYAVSVRNGPNTATKRIEASENMMTLINAMPQVAAVIADLLVEAQDWPQADEIARRLRLTLPPGLIDPSTMTPEEQARAQQASQGAQQQSELAQRMALANYLKTSSEAALNNARAENYSTESQLAPSRANTEAVTAASQAADREGRTRLEAVRVADGH